MNLRYRCQTVHGTMILTLFPSRTSQKAQVCSSGCPPEDAGGAVALPCDAIYCNKKVSR